MGVVVQCERTAYLRPGHRLVVHAAHGRSLGHRGARPAGATRAPAPAARPDAAPDGRRASATTPGLPGPRAARRRPRSPAPCPRCWRRCARASASGSTTAASAASSAARRATGWRSRSPRPARTARRWPPTRASTCPTATLDLPALTDKDIADLAVVARHADMVGLSFVQSAADVQRAAPAPGRAVRQPAGRGAQDRNPPRLREPARAAVRRHGRPGRPA